MVDLPQSPAQSPGQHRTRFQGAPNTRQSRRSMVVCHARIGMFSLPGQPCTILGLVSGPAITASAPGSPATTLRHDRSALDHEIGDRPRTTRGAVHHGYGSRASCRSLGDSLVSLHYSLCAARFCSPKGRTTARIRIENRKLPDLAVAHLRSNVDGLINCLFVHTDMQNMLTSGNIRSRPVSSAVRARRDGPGSQSQPGMNRHPRSASVGISNRCLRISHLANYRGSLMKIPSTA